MGGRNFLVDTENICNYSFIIDNEVNENDKIVLFTSQNSKSVKLAVLENIFKSKAKLEFENVSTGIKDELDVQLIIYITIDSQSNDGEYYIVSNDKIFENAMKYLQTKRSDLRVNFIKTELVKCITTPKKEETKVTNINNKKVKVIDFAKLNSDRRIKECNKLKIRELITKGIENEEITKILELELGKIKSYRNEIKTEGNIRLVNTQQLSRVLKQKFKEELEKYA